MILSFLALSLPAMADMCMPAIYHAYPFQDDAKNIPVNAQIPVLFSSTCGGYGQAEVRLHRMVNGELAEEIASESATISEDTSQIVVLTPPKGFLENTTYALVEVNEYGEYSTPFTTGTNTVAGMVDGAPSLNIDELYYYQDTLGELWMEGEITGVFDPDGLSFVTIYNDAEPDTPVGWELLNSAGDAYLYTSLMSTADTETAQCYFAIQTDAAGTDSDASDVVCATPERVSSGLCSTAGATPAILSSMMALLLGIGRRRK